MFTNDGIFTNDGMERRAGRIAFERPASSTQAGQALSADRLDVIAHDAQLAVSIDATVPRLGQAATASRKLAKRLVDIVIASLALIAMLPVMLLIILAIKLFTGGPAFYSQVRLGRHGVPFRCWKFRTMHVDADNRLAMLLAEDPVMRAEFYARHKLRIDPRITPIGRFLRRTSLDELPQLVNVLRGEMSVVGPRPITHLETDLYGPALPTVLSVRPGMTGLWQVSGRNDLPYVTRVRLDEQYSSMHRLSWDLHIILKTASVMWRGRGAY